MGCRPGRLAAQASGRLAFVLPESQSRRLLSVYKRPSDHFDKCLEPYKDTLPDWQSSHAEYEAEADRLFGNDVRLLVDNEYTRPPAGDDFGSEWGDFPRYTDPGEHHVVVTVTRGDPRNVVYAVVIRHEGNL